MVDAWIAFGRSYVMVDCTGTGAETQKATAQGSHADAAPPETDGDERETDENGSDDEALDTRCWIVIASIVRRPLARRAAARASEVDRVAPVVGSRRAPFALATSLARGAIQHHLAGAVQRQSRRWGRIGCCDEGGHHQEPHKEGDCRRLWDAHDIKEE